MRILYLFFLLFVAQEVLAQVNLSNGLVAYYPFNGNANDASGNNNHPVFNNAVLAADRFGNANSAYAFNGTSSYMQILNKPVLNPTAISICAWVKVTGFYQGLCHGNRIIMKGNSDQTSGTYTLTFDDNGYTGAQNCNGQPPDEAHELFYGTYANSGAFPYVQKDTWISLVFTDDGTTGKFYVNCELRSTNVHSQVSFSNANDLYLGKMNNAQYPYWFNGIMDEIRIYNRVLNAGEVAAYASDGKLLNFITPSVDTIVCSGSVIPLQVSGYNAYQWTPVTGLTASTTDKASATVTSNAQYIVSATSGLGCTEKDTINISVFPKPVTTISKDTSICTGGTAVRLSASGGTNYTWTPTGSLNNPNISSPTATPASSTKYIVTIGYGPNCSVKDSVTLTVISRPAFKLFPKDTAVCAATTVSFNASGGDVYAWQGTGISNPSISNPVATPAGTTNYSVKITNNACAVDTTINTTITVNPIPVVTAGKANDINCANSSSQLTASGALSYIWSPDSTLSNGSISNPIAKPLATATYIVKGTSQNGCSRNDTLTVLVNFANTLSQYLMPNAFTPNGDGLNDCYGITSWGTLQSLQFEIFNRWGQKVFSTTNPSKCWDGRYRNSELAESGVYIYSIKAVNACTTITRSGTFTLIR